jgi:hypothetical protein
VPKARRTGSNRYDVEGMGGRVVEVTRYPVALLSNRKLKFPGDVAFGSLGPRMQVGNVGVVQPGAFPGEPGCGKGDGGVYELTCPDMAGAACDGQVDGHDADDGRDARPREGVLASDGGQQVQGDGRPDWQPRDLPESSEHRGADADHNERDQWPSPPEQDRRRGHDRRQCLRRVRCMGGRCQSCPAMREQRQRDRRGRCRERAVNHGLPRPVAAKRRRLGGPGWWDVHGGRY